MSALKKLMYVMAVAIFGLLAACGEKAPVPQKVSVPTPTPEQIGMKTKAEISAIAKATVEKYGMRNPKACDPATSAPPELLGSKSYQDFPLTGPGIYKIACNDAIRAAVAEEKSKAATAVANAKAREQKLASAKQKACNEIASRTKREACLANVRRRA